MAVLRATRAAPFAAHGVALQVVVMVPAWTLALGLTLGQTAAAPAPAPTPAQAEERARRAEAEEDQIEWRARTGAELDALRERVRALEQGVREQGQTQSDAAVQAQALESRLADAQATEAAAAQGRSDRLASLAEVRADLQSIQRVLTTGSSDIGPALRDAEVRLAAAQQSASELGSPGETGELEAAHHALAQISEALNRDDYQAAKDAVGLAYVSASRAAALAGAQAQRAP